jgi:fibronectin type 3 domain-containing protein
VEGLKQTGGSNTSIRLEWKAITQLPGFVVELSDNENDFSKTQKGFSGTENSYTFYNGVNPGTTYYARVRAYNGQLNDEPIYGDYSDVITCYTSPDAIPDSITQTATTANSVTINWSKANGAALYNVYIQDGFDTKSRLIGETKNTSYAFSNLNPGSTYLVYVSSVVKSQNYVAESLLKSFTIKTAPGMLSPATTEWDQRLRSIRFEWTNNKSVDGYQLQVFNHKGKRIRNINNIRLRDYPSPKATPQSSAANVYNDIISIPYTPSSNAVGFTYRTRAYTMIEDVPVYGAWTARTGLIASPTMKSTRSKNRKTATLRWNKVKGATNYTIYRSTKPQSGFKKIATVKGNRYIVKKLSKNKFYYFYAISNQKVGKKTFKSKAKVVHFVR